MIFAGSKMMIQLVFKVILTVAWDDFVINFIATIPTKSLTNIFTTMHTITYSTN